MIRVKFFFFRISISTSLLLAIFSTSILPAQVLSNQGQVISLINGVTMTIRGGVENSGTISNEGLFLIEEDWTNLGTFSSDKGALVFFGENTQNVDHQGTAVGNLTFGGGGDKILKSHISVIFGGSLELIDGIVYSDASSLLFLQQDVRVSTGNNSSFVDGPLFHIGTGVKYYPIGKNRIFSPVELLDVQGGDPVIGFEVFNLNPNPTFDFELSSVSERRHWRKYELNEPGAFKGSRIRLYANADEPFSSLRNLVVSQADSVQGLFSNLGNTNASVGDVSRWITSERPISRTVFALAELSGKTYDQLLFVPNVFAPSSTNAEEQVAKVYARDVVDDGFIFKIINRWGEIVYETSSFEEANTTGWSGMYNNEIAKKGIYHYILQGRFITGQTFNRKGTILLLL